MINFNWYGYWDRLEHTISSRFRGPAVDLSFPIDPSIVPVIPACSPTLSMGKRKVNFAGQKVIHESMKELAMSEQEMHKRWWTQEDLDEIEKSAKEMGLRLRKLAKERSCHVETAHKKTSLMLINNFPELVKMSASSPDQDLLHWCARSDGRRGLERFASREYGNMRKDDVIGTRTAVFEEQARQRHQRLFSPDGLAKASKAISRRSRTFSLFMGAADAQAAARGITRKSSKRGKVSHKTAIHFRPTYSK